MLDYMVNNFAKRISNMLLHFVELCLFMVDEQSYYIMQTDLKKNGPVCIELKSGKFI